MISTGEAIQKYAQTIAKLPNVTTDSFEVSLNEDGVRQVVKAANRVTGIDGVKSTFGLPWHSHALLQDTGLHARIQVQHCRLDLFFLLSLALQPHSESSGIDCSVGMSHVTV